MCTENNSFKSSFIKDIKQHSLFQFTDLELESFIHTLSPIKKANNKSKTPYFECLERHHILSALFKQATRPKLEQCAMKPKSEPLCIKLIVPNRL